MENLEAVRKPPRVTLLDISSFLSNHLDDKDRLASLEERTNCAIVLLESLPCGRYAVLEKIGEVFFDEAQKYILELERLHLAGMPPIYECASSKLDVQVRKIQQVLVSFVEANSKAWGPMIFQWTVQTLSQICGQYGTNRHFSSLALQERFQMWLNCTAANVLLEIMVSCLHKIIHKNQDNCLKCLLNATLSSAPFFNWVLAHICCVFPEIIPYKLLYHALEAFSNQSRKIDLIIETTLSIFHLIHPQKGNHINSSVFKLFSESLVSKEKENHIILCTIPFLLRICIKSINLLSPLIDKVLESLSHDHLDILKEQSMRRDEILQRRLMNRVTDCIKEVDLSGYELFQFLIKYSCQEDDVLIEENPMLAASAQTFCCMILELLRLLFRNEINIYLHHHSRIVKDQNSEVPSKSPFLHSLGKYAKQLSEQMLNNVGPKREIFREILMLMAMQEGIDEMTDVLIFVLMNSSVDLNKPCLMSLLTEFKVYEPLVADKTFEKIFRAMVTGNTYSFTQIRIFLRNIKKLIEEEKCGRLDYISVLSCLKPYVKVIAQILILSSDHEEIAIIALELIEKLCSSDLQISDYAVMIQAIVSHYLSCMNKLKLLSTECEIDHFYCEIKLCNQLLLKTVNHYVGIQQFAIRFLLEGIMRREEELFVTEPEEPLIKVELMKKNFLMSQGNRFSTITSVMFKDGLKLNKRKADIPCTHKSYSHQIFINTLSSLLCLCSGFCSKQNDYIVKDGNFAQCWGEKKFIKMFPSAHAYAATVLVELVCPEMVPIMVWPDEDFLKYTIERDLNVKNTFLYQPLLWDILELISTARPALYHCSVLIQSLFGISIKFWHTNRNLYTSATPHELENICKLMHILRNAGWLPPQIDSISDTFTFIKPRELYDILSAIWKYFKATSFAPECFINRDQLGLPVPPVNTECLQNMKAVIQIVFLRNIDKLGHLYSRFLGDSSC